MTDCLPNPLSRFAHILKSTCGATVNLTFTLDSFSPSSHPIGVCLDGIHTGKFLHCVKLDADVQCASLPEYVQVYAVESNAFNLPAGTKMTFRVGDKHASDDEGFKEVVGVAFDSNCDALLVEFCICSVSSRKPRGQLKPVRMPCGAILNRDETMRAVSSWLKKKNAEFASACGVEKLVWCEEFASARADRNQVRAFYRVDLQDANRKKSCPNAKSAIEHMEAITKCDFYKDMREIGDKLDF